jgi:hypothetical protein
VITERDRLRIKAHVELHRALRRRQLVKPRACQECGGKPKAAFLLRAHHPDHSAPLDVEWLCSKCHGKRNLEAVLSRLFAPEEWTRIVQRVKHDGIGIRGLVLSLLRDWVETS